ncbi:carbohydrate ABC transporter permease [Nocardia arizonensis]|uniref:carbohydrate ABC transporter permease n=1 Tax=Nocardia arizonensis TaxID=1141647 RepID=UPI0006D06792|nr:sugar ABC transporter permease [Nocardia arizonensis]
MSVLTAAVRIRHRPLAYSAPVALSLVIWVYAPMIATAVVSVLEWNLTTRAEFVGFDNFRRLFDDEQFRRAIWQTGVYVLLMLPLATLVPLGLAVALWLRPGRVSTVYRALLFLPVVLAPAANAVSWQFMLNPLQGIANTVLRDLGLPAQNWLGDAALAPAVIVVITAGKIIGLDVLLFSAALANIDQSGLEAARVEGASTWETVRYIVLPQLTRSVVLLGLLCVLLAGQWVFTNVAILTQGGPEGSTDNIYYRLYTYGFTFFDSGTAAASAVLIVLAIGGAYLLGQCGARLVRRAGATAGGAR